LHLVGSATSSVTVSRTEQILAMATGFIAVFVAGLWAAYEVSVLGTSLCKVTFGVIDWIGTASSALPGCQRRPEDALPARSNILQVAAALLGFYFSSPLTRMAGGN
jgi:hypothetical protein